MGAAYDTEDFFLHLSAGEQAFQFQKSSVLMLHLCHCRTGHLFGACPDPLVVDGEYDGILRVAVSLSLIAVCS